VVVIICVGSLVVTIQTKVRCTRRSSILLRLDSALCTSFLGADCELSFEITSELLPNYLYRSFFQGLCVLGYCIAPLDIAALISCFVRIIYVRAPIALLAWAWCVWGKGALP
jgi:hypothetical protein